MEASFTRGGIAVGVIGTKAEREALRAVFEAAAAEQGWTSGDDLGDRSEGSVCLGAWVDGRLAGGVELCVPDECGNLPIFATWRELDHAGITRPAELVLLALAPEFRGTPGLLWTLCAEMWRHCARRGVTDLLAAVTPRNQRLYARLGWCPEPVGPARDHWGEPCLPCRIGIAKAAEAVAAKVRAAPSLAFVTEQAHRD